MKKITILSILLFQIFNITVLGFDNKMIQEEDLIQIYSIAFDSFMPSDKSIMNGRNYIAIDMKTETFKEISESGKQQILNNFKKYGIKVVDESFETLKEKGLTSKLSLDKNNLRGILLIIKEVNFISDKEVIIEGSWFVTGTAGEGFKSIIVYEDGKWRLKDKKWLWIS